MCFLYFTERDVRLKRGDFGQVQMLLFGEWGAVCGHGWDITDAQVVCRQLGFSHASDAYVITDSDVHFVVLIEVNCEGQEKSLADCLLQWPSRGNYCEDGEYAGAICQGLNLCTVRDN